MTNWDRFEVSKAYVPAGTPNVADLINQIENDWTLPSAQATELASNLREICNLIGYPAYKIPADIVWLEAQLRSDLHEPLSLSFIKEAMSKAKMAFALASLPINSKRPDIVLTPKWQKLLSQCSRENRRRLSRLVKFCACFDVEPIQVDESTIDALEVSIRYGTLMKERVTIMSRIITAWNECADSFSDWPKTILNHRYRRTVTTLSCEELPSSFHEDVLNMKAQMTSDISFDEGWPNRPLNAEYVKNFEIQIRCLATALVADGFPASKLLNLSVLLQFENAIRALRYLKEHTSLNSNRYLVLCAAIMPIARYYLGEDQAYLDKMQHVRSSFKKNPDGMAKITRAHLRQFDDEKNVQQLLELPSELMREAQRTFRAPITAANLAQASVAIELLLMCPMKPRLLAGLNTAEHFYWSHFKGKDQWVIRLAGEKSAVGTYFEYAIPEESFELLSVYLKSFLPVLNDHKTPWLFPIRFKSSHKTRESLSALIVNAVRKHSDLTVYPRLIRHIGAKLFLERNPGSQEVISRVMGFRSPDTAGFTYESVIRENSIKQLDFGVFSQEA